VFGDTISGTYEQYSKSAETRNIPFEITKQEFSGFIQQSCYICKKPNNKTHRNGIDRYDNSIGYILENCRTCCGECNYMKHTLDYGGLLSKFKTIHTHFIENLNIMDNIQIEPRIKRFIHPF